MRGPRTWIFFLQFFVGIKKYRQKNNVTCSYALARPWHEPEAQNLLIRHILLNQSTISHKRFHQIASRKKGKRKCPARLIHTHTSSRRPESLPPVDLPRDGGLTHAALTASIRWPAARLPPYGHVLHPPPARRPYSIPCGWLLDCCKVVRRGEERGSAYVGKERRGFGHSSYVMRAKSKRSTTVARTFMERHFFLHMIHCFFPSRREKFIGYYYYY